MKNLILFGDSMLCNFGTEQIDKVESVFPDLHIHNCATGGLTTAGGLKKVGYISRLRPDIVLLSFGINDLFRHKLTPKDFLVNLEKIIEYFSNSRVIVWLTPKANDLNDIKGSNEFNTEIAKYNEIVKSFCSKNKVEFIDSFTDYDIEVGKKDQYHEDDGIHLTDDGYGRFIEALIKVL